MPLSYEQLIHKATLWERANYDDQGQPLVKNPVEIDCRWRPTNRSAAGPNNSTIAIEVSVVVDREIPVDSILWLGTLDCLPGTMPEPRSDLFQVKTTHKTDNVSGTESRLRVGLVRFGNTLPQLAE